MKKLLLLVAMALFGFSYTTHAQTSCDTLRNWNPAGLLSLYSGVTGYIPGHDVVGAGNVLRWAEPLNAPTTTEIKGLRFIPTQISDAGGSITIHVWDDNAGEPGTSLTSEVIPIVDLQDMFYNVFEFSTPVNVTGDFFVGIEVEYSNYPGNEIALVTQEVTNGTLRMFENTNGWSFVNTQYTIGTPAAPVQLSLVMDALVTTAPTPVPDFASVTTLQICEGSSFELTANGFAANMTEYNWELWTWDAAAQELVSLIDQDAGSPEATLTPNGIGDYAIALYSEQNCSFEAILYSGFEVLPEFQYDINVTDESCTGLDGAIELANFTGGGTDYVHSWTSTNYYLFNNPSADTLGLEAGTYALNFGPAELNGGSFSFLSGCEVTEVVTVGTIPGEQVTVGSGTTICPGDNASLTASGNGTIEWYDGAVLGINLIGTGTSQSVNPTITTTYEVVLTDANNCTDSDFIEVTVTPEDDASFTFNNFCLGASNAPTNIVTTGGTFTFNPIPSDGATISTSTGEIFDGVLGTTYTVQYQTSGTCPDLSTENVTVQPNDDPSFEYLLSCDGNSIVPSNIATNGGTFDFSIAPTGGETIDANSGEITGATVGTVYSVEYTTPAGVCQSSSVEQVEIFGLPSVDAGNDETICAGDQVALLATGVNTFTWDNGLGTGANQSVTPTATTIYTVTGTDANGCQDSDQVEITVNALPSVNGGLDQVVCEGEDVTLEATNPDGAVVSWDGGVSDGVAFTPSLGATTYTVTANLNGCESSDEVLVTVGAVPTVSASSTSSEACLNHEPIALNGSPAGGTFSGPGVDGSTFNPANAGEGVHEIIYTFVDGNGCEADATITIIVDGCLSLDEQSLSTNLTIAPNPAVTHFDITVTDGFMLQSITVLSAEGRVVKSTNLLPSTQTTVDVSNLSKGTYFVKVRTAFEEVTKKIIVH